MFYTLCSCWNANTTYRYVCYIVTRCIYLVTSFSHTSSHGAATVTFGPYWRNFCLNTHETKSLFVSSHSHTLQIIFRMVLGDIQYMWLGKYVYSRWAIGCEVSAGMQVIFNPVWTKHFVRQKFESILFCSIKRVQTPNTSKETANELY